MQVQTHIDPLGEGLSVLLPFAGLSAEGGCWTMQQFRVYHKVRESQHPGSLSSASFSAPMLGNSAIQHTGAASSFVLPPLPNALQARKLFVPVQPKESSDHAPCSGLCPPSPQEHR